MTDARERARIASNTRWSKPGAREEASRILRAANRARYARLVDPDGVMSPAELDAAIVNARRAVMARVRAQRAAAATPPQTQLRSATR